MTQIVLTADQAAILAGEENPVAICRPDGSIAGLVSQKCRVITPTNSAFTDEEVAEAERQLNSGGLEFTTEEVL